MIAAAMGWIGTFGTIGAYVMLSRGSWHSASLRYAALNGVGASSVPRRARVRRVAERRLEPAVVVRRRALRDGDVADRRVGG